MTERTKKMLAELDPAAQPVFEAMLKMVDEKLGGDKYIVYEGRRPQIRQDAYFAQGRKSLEEVNEKRAAAGLYLFKSAAENYIISDTETSRHTRGLAMDIVPLNGEGNPTWDLGHYWNQYVAIRDCGRAAGLICGADWKKFTDWPHYELREES